MEIKLTWDNPNIDEVTVNIYRGESLLDRDNLGTPIASLNNGETEYIDTDLIRGNRYFYVLETINENGRAVSANFEIIALPYTGPGPQELKIGNMGLGYYGKIPEGLLISQEALCSRIGLTAGSFYIHTSNTSKLFWHKFARNGKILFIPQFPIKNEITWDDIYKVGAIYGIDGPGPFTASDGTEVNQNTIITIGRDRFRVRTIKGGPDREDGLFTYPESDDNSLIPFEETARSEWDDLMGGISEWVLPTQRTVNMDNLTYSEMFNGSYTRYNITQERVEGETTKCLLRGDSANALSSIGRVRKREINSSSSSTTWRPVLEYISPDQE